MKDQVERASRWIYQGIFGVLVEGFRVPAEPPTLPTEPGEAAISFRPGQGFLHYLKFWFWLALLGFDGVVLIGWLILAYVSPLAGIILALPAAAIAILPDIVAYIAIHLRYDTTWYVLTHRSLRIRRGIWTIHETTITFENVQNITLLQGPVQRYFGIGNIAIQTAGGGGHAHPSAGATAGHLGLIEGVENPHQIRDLILGYLRRARSAGLGDEGRIAARDDQEPKTPRGTWNPAHLEVLRQIRDLARSTASA